MCSLLYLETHIHTSTPAQQRCRHPVYTVFSIFTENSPSASSFKALGFSSNLTTPSLPLAPSNSTVPLSEQERESAKSLPALPQSLAHYRAKRPIPSKYICIHVGKCEGACRTTLSQPTIIQNHYPVIHRTTASQAAHVAECLFLFRDGLQSACGFANEVIHGNMHDVGQITW